ncbi:MAG: hypothetical protein P8183_06500 [Anaerolineae bacterium]
MTESGQEWDYCKIEFHLRNKGEPAAVAGPAQVWLAFVAHATGPHQNYLAGEVEFPVPINFADAPLVPQRNNIGHVNMHQNLLLELQKDGWELLPEKSGSWWEKRLRRPARPKKSPIGWVKKK